MARNLIIQILGDADQFGKELDKAAGKTRKFGKAAGVAGLAIAGGLTVALTKSVSAAMDSQRVNAQTESTLKALGISYKAHGKEIDNVIQKTSKLAAIDDEELQGAFNDLVRSGGNVQKALKDTALAANISRGAHIDLAKAEKLILSAETGRVAGLQKYVGVLPKITTEQDKVKASLNAYKATHKHMTQAEKDRFAALLVTAKAEDKAATARNAIAVATKKYTGASEAYGKTAQGAQDRMRVSIENLEESIGKILLPTVEALASKMATLADFFEKHEGITKILIGSLVTLAGVLLSVSVATKVYAAGQAVATAAMWLFNAALTANPIGIVIVALTALGAALYVAWTKSETFRRIVTGTWEAVKTGAEAVLNFFRNNWPIIATLISGPFAPLVALATNAFGIRSALVGAFNAVKEHVGSVITGIASAFAALPGKIGGAISGAMGDLWAILKKIFNPVEWAKKILGFLGFGSPSPFFVDIGKKIIESIAHGVGKFAGVVEDAVKGIVGKLNPFAGSTQGGGVSGKGGTGVGKDGSTLPLLMSWAKQEGIGITSTTSGNHVKGSYHYQGRAVDVAGSASQMAKFFLDTIKRFGVGRITELFYDPMGYYVDNGRVVKGAIGGHSDHVHLALAKGGIITKPTVALMGEAGPEAVVPLSKWQQGWEQVKKSQDTGFKQVKQATTDGWTQVKKPLYTVAGWSQVQAPKDTAALQAILAANMQQSVTDLTAATDAVAATDETTAAVTDVGDVTNSLLIGILESVKPLDASIHMVVDAIDRGRTRAGGTGGGTGNIGGGGSSGGFTQVPVTGGGSKGGFTQVSATATEAEIRSLSEPVIHNVLQIDGKVLYENWKKQAARDVKRNGGTGIRS